MPLGRLRLRWENDIRKYFLNSRGENGGDWDWKKTVENKYEWKRICIMARGS